MICDMLVVVLVACAFQLVQSDCTKPTYFHLVSNRNYLKNKRNCTFYTAGTQHKLRCMRQCAERNICYNYQYSKNENLCILCIDTLEKNTGLSQYNETQLSAQGFWEKEDIDDCLSSPCQNNETCIDKYYQHQCVCEAGFTGDNCETTTTEYIVVFPRAHQVTYCNTTSFNVIITAHKNDVSISMLNNETGATNNYQLSSGQVQRNTYLFSTYAYTTQNTVTNGKILLVTITGAASVHVELPCYGAPYMYTVWPITSQHIKFYGMVTQRSGSLFHDFALVAKYDNTQVTLQYNYLSSTTKMITLNQYQLYAHATTTAYDMVEITADKPITVISVYRCINEGSGGCDGAAAQLPPVAQWSKEHFIPQFQLLSQNINVNLTVISSERSNTIMIQNASVQTTYQINKLQFLNIQSGAAALSITCTHACLVQVIIPCNYEPDMAFITHPKSYTTNTMIFSSQDSNNYQDSMVLTIVAQSNITSTLKFDGNAVVSWNPIPGKPFSYSNIVLTKDIHTIIAEGKFSGYVISMGQGGMVREIG